jgi:uncharacterized protein (DUF1501 family)
MKVTRRQFVKGGVAAFTVTFAAPEFLSDLARAQGARARNFVVLYLSGGNDALRARSGSVTINSRSTARLALARTSPRL